MSSVLDNVVTSMPKAIDDAQVMVDDYRMKPWHESRLSSKYFNMRAVVFLSPFFFFTRASIQGLIMEENFHPDLTTLEKQLNLNSS